MIRTTGAGGCYPGEPCDPLPPALYVVFSRGSTSARARLAASGAFSMHLAPGKYTVTVAPPTGLLAPGSDHRAESRDDPAPARRASPLP